MAFLRIRLETGWSSFGGYSKAALSQRTADKGLWNEVAGRPIIGNAARNGLAIWVQRGSTNKVEVDIYCSNDKESTHKDQHFVRTEFKFLSMSPLNRLLKCRNRQKGNQGLFSMPDDQENTNYQHDDNYLEIFQNRENIYS